jgi:hypothetical protein
MSSFDFNPDSQQQQPVLAPPQERIGRFSIVVLSAFVMLALVWAAWNPLGSAAKAAMGRHHAREACGALDEKRWGLAVEHVRKARAWAPQDPEVIRAVVEFLNLSGGDPAGLAQQLQSLAEIEPLDPDEQIMLGRSLAITGKTGEARAVYDKLPRDTSTSKEALEMLSGILRQEGNEAEAAEIRRRATLKEPDSPEARLKTALEDMKSSFSEVRRGAHDQLMRLTELKTQVAMEAVTHLTINPLLTAGEARVLLERVEAHAHKSLPVRLGVVSVIMRLSPLERDALLDAEISRFKDGDDGSLEHLARWLALEKQHGRLLRVVPAALAAKSRELYPIVAQALAEEERWKDLHEMLTSGRPPVSAARVSIWLAEAASHLEPNLAQSTRLLEKTIEASVREGNLANLLAAAAVAEKLNLNDLALSAWVSAAEKAGAESLPLLQKAHDLASRQKNTAMLLETARRLHELRPDSTAFADRLAYLRLLLGAEMESVDQVCAAPLEKMRRPAGLLVTRVPPALLHALAAYRMGDIATLRRQVVELPDVSAREAGLRAVAAGLLSLAGENARAYQLAEKIPSALLLDEERAFLQKAL